MQAGNVSPINTSFSSVHPVPTKRASIAFEPYALHIISSIIRDLKFLRHQGYISQVLLEEIVTKLPKPVHTPSAPSPSSSPQPKSPTTSVKSNASQKRDSIIQRPASESSQHSQNREQQLNHPTVHGEPIVDVDDNQNQRRHTLQKSITPPSQQITSSPPPLQDTPSVVQPQNDDSEQSPSENRSNSKPAIPSRASIYIAQSKSNTGAILATRPLPLPPNAPNNSSVPQPHPVPGPVFNNKFEEAEYERSLNCQVVNETTLPAYSLAIVEAMWDFYGDDVDDLSFVKGDIIDVVEYVNPDWWRGRHQRSNKIGIFPKIYTKIVPHRSQSMSEQGMVNNGYYSQILPQHSNTISAYTSQTIRPYVEQSPSLQHQQLSSTQQQQNYAYQQQQYSLINARNSAGSMNGMNGHSSFYR